MATVAACVACFVVGMAVGAVGVVVFALCVAGREGGTDVDG